MVSSLSLGALMLCIKLCNTWWGRIWGWDDAFGINWWVERDRERQREREREGYPVRSLAYGMNWYGREMEEIDRHWRHEANQQMKEPFMTTPISSQPAISDGDNYRGVLCAIPIFLPSITR